MPDTHDPELQLAEVFGDVARTLLAEDDVDAVLAKILVLAVHTVEASDGRRRSGHDRSG